MSRIRASAYFLQQCIIGALHALTSACGVLTVWRYVCRCIEQNKINGGAAHHIASHRIADSDPPSRIYVCLVWVGLAWFGLCCALLHLACPCPNPIRASETARRDCEGISTVECCSAHGNDITGAVCLGTCRVVLPCQPLGCCMSWTSMLCDANKNCKKYGLNSFTIHSGFFSSDDERERK
ncbi:hypothetical protein GGR58DRAFT_356416 [Xylaria digitata]|nr:hypothetical protein GGR58DRAFT_356416 [Xylaria digitata]